MSGPFRFWAVIPAAGSSRRMADGVAKSARQHPVECAADSREEAGRAVRLPKQYLQLAGRAVLEWSAAPFLARPDCAGVIVVLAPGDQHWPTLALARNAKVQTVIGGVERADSVRQGLAVLRSQLGDDDWVLVHDAARPCLQAGELTALIDRVRGDEVGGLLAAPLVDTLKRADGSGRVAETMSRERLWRALTPQMFRFGVLTRTLADAAQRGIAVTDEAQAVELAGFRPLLVAGSTDNLKITLPEDLPRAERILATMQPS